MNLNIIENFYSADDFKHMATMALVSQYQAAWQPRNKFYMSRSHGYPCFESWFLENDLLYQIFLKTFQEKTNFKIKKIFSLFRKIYSKELKNVIKYGMIPHQDNKEYNLAGIIHFNTFGLNDGTGLFSTYEENNMQIEPDIIIGAKPNRCVFYDSQLWHKPLQDENTEMRIVQPFFIILE